MADKNSAQTNKQTDLGREPKCEQNLAITLTNKCKTERYLNITYICYKQTEQCTSQTSIAITCNTAQQTLNSNTSIYGEGLVHG